MNLTRTIAVVVGTPQVVDLLGWPTPTTICAIPGASGTMAVEWSTTATAVTNPGAASWSAWPAGTVSTKTTDTLDSPIVAMRVTALVSNGSFEMAGA